MARAATRESALPAGIAPRGFSRVQAAAYVGVSPSLFDRAVKDGLMPKPFRLYGRTLWNIAKLNAAIDALDTDDAADDPCSRLML